MTEGSNTYTATLSAFGYTNLQLSWANVEIDKTAPLQILGVSFDRTAEGTSVTANWTLPEGHDIVKVVFTELVGNGDTYTNDNGLTAAEHIKDKEGGIVAEFPITGANETSGIIDNLTANAPYWFMVHTEDAAGNKSVRARDSVAGTVAPDDNGFMVRFTSSQLDEEAPYITNATGYFDGTHYIFSWDNPNGYDVKIAKKGANSPVYIFLFVFCFSVTFACLWEIYEFAFDLLLDMDMQHAGDLVGQNALFDTMFDMISGTIGAIISALCCSLLTYKDKNFVLQFHVTKVKKNKISEIEE